MADRFDVATRKGLFRFDLKDGQWRTDTPHFLGEPVSAVLRDARDDTVYVALNHGHFGAKFHRSDDGGASYSELAVPKYPEGGEASLDFIWKPMPLPRPRNSTTRTIFQITASPLRTAVER